MLFFSQEPLPPSTREAGEALETEKAGETCAVGLIP